MSTLSIRLRFARINEETCNRECAQQRSAPPNTSPSQLPKIERLLSSAPRTGAVIGQQQYGAGNCIANRCQRLPGIRCRRQLSVARALRRASNFARHTPDAITKGNTQHPLTEGIKIPHKSGEPQRIITFFRDLIFTLVMKRSAGRSATTFVIPQIARPPR